MHGDLTMMRDEKIISKELMEKIDAISADLEISIHGFDYAIKSSDEKVGAYYMAALRAIQTIAEITSFDVENITAQINMLDCLLRENEDRGMDNDS